MKSFKICLFVLTMIVSASIITGCGNSGKKEVKIEKATDLDGKEYTSAYICPMHCVGSGSETMGKCPACGMDYVANEKHNHDGHNHDGHDHGDHEGHDHGDHEGHDH